MNSISHKFDNLDEMDPFIERHKLKKFIKGKRDNLHRTISIKEIIITFQKGRCQA